MTRLTENVQEAVQRIRYWALRGALNEYIRAIDAGEPPAVASGSWGCHGGPCSMTLPNRGFCSPFEGAETCRRVEERGEWNVELSLWDLKRERRREKRPVIALIRADNAWLKTFSNPGPIS